MRLSMVAKGSRAFCFTTVRIRVASTASRKPLLRLRRADRMESWRDN
jgi:hypothetical protein